MQKVLIVDNNRTIVEMLSASLSEAGFLPFKAYDGIEALDQIRKEVPDFIVLDLIMPKIDGYRLARYLKSDPEFSAIPIIILTGIAAEDARQIFEVEADAFIAKGKIEDTFRNLLATLRWLDAKKAPRRGILGSESLCPREMTSELLLVKQHFDSMLQVMAEGVLEMDENHRVFFSNQAACRLLGKSELELFGKGVAEVFPNEPGLLEYMTKLPQGRFTRKPGVQLALGDRVVSVLATPFFFNKAYLGSIAVLEDITAQMQKERALEELSSSVISHAPIGIGVLDADGRIILANEHLSRLSGADGQVQNKLLADLPAFADPAFQAFLGEAIPDGPVSREVNCPPSGGRESHTFHLTASALRRQERPLTLLLVDDVTEQARLQRELLAANQELETANQAKSNFLSIVSHELRTPLSVIRGYLSLILDGKIPGAGGEALEALQTSDRRARHLQKLIEELLDLSRIESGRITLKQDAISLPRHLTEVVDMFAADIEKKRLKVAVDVPADIPEVIADHGKVHQVFSNLLSNAVKFTQPGGAVTLSAVAGEGSVRVSIADTGIGIAADKIPLIFNKFFQVDSTDSRMYGGAGLGLSIVRMILDAMGGTIEVTSTLGQGSVFAVTLPRTGPAQPGRPSPPPESRQATGAEMAPGPRTVLLCEDDEDTVKIIAHTLPKEECSLLICGSSLEVLEQVYSRPVDLVMMDLRLPLIDGYDLCRMLRASAVASRIPIVILSAAGQEDEIRRGYEAGADVYMVKPFSPSDLLEVVRAHLMRPRA